MNNINKLSSLGEEVINNFPTGIFVINPSGDVLIENPALKNIFGSEAEHANVGLEIYNFIKSDSQLQQYMDMATSIKKSVKIDRLKYSLHDNESEKILTIWIVPILDQLKSIKYYFFLVEDMTEHTLRDSKIQRAERLSVMGILASGIAEEIKYPLSHIMINLDFVERNTSEDSPMRSYIQAIKDDLSRIKFVSKQIRDLSLPHREDDKEIYEVTKLFSSHPIKVKLNVLKERGISIKTIFPDISPKIKANENQLIQAMIHILQNAAEAMPEEGTLLISVDALNENGNDIVLITIADTGFGISKENLANIFKPFFTTKGHSATGLGLMVSYSIIDNLGGAIGIKSKPGVGTSVRIALPAYNDN
ncbi:MAG: PAS domain-containing protein [Spirochaetes bacterium]|nr:PAS domain-containing protein [Spirochaetota bacterium]